MSTLNEQLGIIKGKISSMSWSNNGYDYYELLTKLHLLLVKNELRKAYYDETTLISCKYFENHSDKEIDEIIIERVPNYKSSIDALNQLQKIGKDLGLHMYNIKQIPIEIKAKCNVPKKVSSEFSTSFSCGKQIIIFKDEKTELEIKKIATGKQKLGDVLEYPSCCIDWMIETKTKSLEDCYEFYVENFGYEDHDEMMEFLYRNFESDSIPHNEKRMIEIEKNHVIKTISAYPFVFHQACESCLKNIHSPTAILNKKYDNFARKISKEFHQEILNKSIRIKKHRENMITQIENED